MRTLSITVEKAGNKDFTIYVKSYVDGVRICTVTYTVQSVSISQESIVYLLDPAQGLLEYSPG